MSGSLTHEEVKSTIDKINCTPKESGVAGAKKPQGTITGTGGNSHKQKKAPEKGF